MGTMFTVTLAVFDGSAMEAAVIVTVPFDGIAAGAV
jgi:hypothetical protein